MEFARLNRIVGDEPVFETGLLLAGDVDPGDVRRQLSRWVKARRLYQLRRGLYALAPPFQKVKPHPFVIANRMVRVRGSYVSLQSALAFHDLTTQILHAVDIALENGTERPCLDYPSLRIFWFSDSAWSKGGETYWVDDAPIHVYGPTKSVADSFKYRARSAWTWLSKRLNSTGSVVTST